MPTLLIVPLSIELDPFLDACRDHGLARAPTQLGRLPATCLPELGFIVVEGGLGKVQFGVQAQHAIDAGGPWEAVICAGVGGALSEVVAPRDVVVGTETVEHDIRNNFGPPMIPRYLAGAALVERFRNAAPSQAAFSVHFGPIASGDEDIVGSQRRMELHQQTGALAVAWEGAGGAHASQFSDVPYIEIRAISDSANNAAVEDFIANLEPAMRNLAALIIGAFQPEQGT